MRVQKVKENYHRPAPEEKKSTLQMILTAFLKTITGIKLFTVALFFGALIGEIIRYFFKTSWTEIPMIIFGALWFAVAAIFATLVGRRYGLEEIHHKTYSSADIDELTHPKEEKRDS